MNEFDKVILIRDRQSNVIAITMYDPKRKTLITYEVNETGLDRFKELLDQATANVIQ